MTDLPAPLRWAAMAWAFAFGAVVGSFLNVVVARVPAGESVVRPRSRCPVCRTPIAWHDNVPVLSWIALGGRCRSCGTSISFRYPLVEILGGCAALVAAWRHGLGPEALAEFAFVATLLALSFIDLDTWLLPHVLTIPLLVGGLALSALHLTSASTAGASALGAALGWLSFAAVSFVGEKVLKKEALGFGDVWLLGAIGAWMGATSLLPVVLLASLQGTVVGLALIVLGRAQPGPQPVPSEPGAPGPDAGTASTTGAATGTATGTATEPEPAPAGGAPPPEAVAGEADPDADWVPPRNAVPFGPFLALGALEWLWLQAWIEKAVPALAIFR